MKKITKSVVLAALSALLLFGCKNSTAGLVKFWITEEGNPDDNPSEDIPFEKGEYISATGTSEGIEITFADNVRIKAYKSISVNGIPIRIDTSEEDEKNNRKTYIFPFAEKGKTYVVTYNEMLTVDGVDQWVTESVECVAGGGLRYTDYLNIDSLNKCTLTVSYNGPNYPGGLFSGMFTPYFTKDEVIMNDEIFSDFTFGYSVVLGELNWTHTAYWTWTRRDNWANSSIFDDALSEGFDFYSGEDNVPTELEWEEYDYKYAAYATPSFTLKNYPGTSFSVQKDLWSAQKTYDPSAGVETKPNGKYITAESTDKGIKITVINDAFEIRNCSFVGMDDGVEIPIKLADTYGDAREFVFPFTESGKKYYITVSGFVVNGDMWYWKEETVSCVAGGGIDYKQYVDLFSDSVLSINYNDSYMYDEQIGSCFEIKLTNCKIPNSLRQNIDTLRFGCGVLFGENYYCDICNFFDFDQNEVYESVVSFWFTENDWSQYGYQYTGYMTPYLTLRDYQNTTFELPTV